MKFALILVALLATAANAQIQRSSREVAAFKREVPCPTTGRPRGACPGWQVDHSIPLCAGGMDHRSNMAWLTVEDHQFKTLVDARECRKLAKMARTPAR